MKCCWGDKILVTCVCTHLSWSHTGFQMKYEVEEIFCRENSGVRMETKKTYGNIILNFPPTPCLSQTLNSLTVQTLQTFLFNAPECQSWDSVSPHQGEHIRQQYLCYYISVSIFCLKTLPQFLSWSSTAQRNTWKIPKKTSDSMNNRIY